MTFKPFMIIFCLIGVALTAKVASTVDYIVNGDFSQYYCGNQACIFNLTNFKNTSVQGWVPDPELQIGVGSVYNPNIVSKTSAVQLAGNANTCIKQIIPKIPAGQLELTFSYSARSIQKPENCQFNVSFNGNLLTTLKPTNYKIVSKSITINVDKELKNSELRFCGLKNTNNPSYGAILTSVQLEGQAAATLASSQIQISSKTPIVTNSIQSLPDLILTTNTVNTKSSTGLTQDQIKVLTSAIDQTSSSSGPSLTYSTNQGQSSTNRSGSQQQIQYQTISNPIITNYNQTQTILPSVTVNSVPSYYTSSVVSTPTLIQTQPIVQTIIPSSSIQTKTSSTQNITSQLVNDMNKQLTVSNQNIVNNGVQTLQNNINDIISHNSSPTVNIPTVNLQTPISLSIPSVSVSTVPYPNNLNTLPSIYPSIPSPSISNVNPTINTYIPNANTISSIISNQLTNSGINSSAIITNPNNYMNPIQIQNPTVNVLPSNIQYTQSTIPSVSISQSTTQNPTIIPIVTPIVPIATPNILPIVTPTVQTINPTISTYSTITPTVIQTNSQTQTNNQINNPIINQYNSTGTAQSTIQIITPTINSTSINKSSTVSPSVTINPTVTSLSPSISSIPSSSPVVTLNPSVVNTPTINNQGTNNQVNSAQINTNSNTPSTTIIVPSNSVIAPSISASTTSIPSPSVSTPYVSAPSVSVSTTTMTPTPPSNSTIAPSVSISTSTPSMPTPIPSVSVQTPSISVSTTTMATASPSNSTIVPSVSTPVPVPSISISASTSTPNPSVPAPSVSVSTTTTATTPQSNSTIAPSASASTPIPSVPTPSVSTTTSTSASPSNLTIVPSTSVPSISVSVSTSNPIPTPTPTPVIVVSNNTPTPTPSIPNPTVTTINPPAPTVISPLVVAANTQTTNVSTSTVNNPMPISNNYNSSTVSTSSNSIPIINTTQIPSSLNTSTAPINISAATSTLNSTNSSVPISQSTQLPVNLLSNGDFQHYSCSNILNAPCTWGSLQKSNSNLPSWSSPSDIEIGLASFYNQNIQNSKNVVLHLGMSKNTCIRQQIGLKYGYYNLQFDYAPTLINSTIISQSFFIIKFNGRNVKNILPVDQYLHHQKILIKAINGINTLEFCSFGSSDIKTIHGSVLDNISLFTKTDLTDMKGDLIINGDFQQNSCQNDNCIWNTNTFKQSNLKGWLPDPQLQIGKGTIYNSHAGISTVADLSPNGNSCIKQTIKNCNSGKFQLEFSWAARQSQNLYNSIFQVKINGIIKQSYIPNDYLMHRETLVLSLESKENVLSFCSYGINDDYGAIIDDVKMYVIQECSNPSLIQL